MSVTAAPDPISTVPTDIILTPAHRAYLTKAAIDVDVALEAGVRSIRVASDLPKDLAFAAGQVPGILFMHTDIHGKVTPQYRPDDAVRAKPEVKYIQAKGSGSVIGVHPVRMLPKVGRPGIKAILFAEGTKQGCAAATHAADDVLVVTLQGCANYSADGIPLEDIYDLVGLIPNVVIAFDADLHTNLNVWEAGRRLRDHILTITTRDDREVAKVGFVRLPAGSKVGLDDYLASVPAERRPALLAALIERAEPLGRAPAKKRANTTGENCARVDWDAGQICYPGRVVNGVVIPSEAIAEFAARFIQTSEVIDDLNLDTSTGHHRGLQHTLEIASGVGADRREWTVDNVSDADLHDVRSWLARIPGGPGALLHYKSHLTEMQDLVMAIRDASSETTTPIATYLRCGLVKPNDTNGFVHPTGFITARGAAGGAKSILDAPLSSIGYPDISSLSAESIRADIRMALVEPIGLLEDPTAWYMLEGAHGCAYTGKLCKSAPVIVGPPQAGKTELVQAFASAFGPLFSNSSMCSANSTTIALGDSGRGMHHHPLVVDDLFRPGESKEKEQKDAVGIELLTRRAYGGGSEGRGRMKGNTGVGRSFVGDPPDRACPVIILVGERMPSAKAYLSTVERMLIVTVTKTSLMKPGKTPRLREIAASGARNRATSSYIQWLVARIDKIGGLEKWAESLEKRCTEIQDKLGQDYPILTTPRSREVPAPIIMGWSLRVKHALEMGAMTEIEARKHNAAGYKALAAAAVRHLLDELGDVASPAAEALEALRSLIASHDAAVNGDDIPYGATVFATKTTMQGVEYLAMNPLAAGTLIYGTRDPRADRSSFVRAMAGTGVVQGGNKLHPVRFPVPGKSGDARLVRCVLVPMDVWEPTDDTLDTKAAA